MSSIIMAVARTLHAAGELKMLSFLSVCQSVCLSLCPSRFERQSLRERLRPERVKELELRSDFDILDRGRLFNFISVRL